MNTIRLSSEVEQDLCRLINCSTYSNDGTVPSFEKSILLTEKQGNTSLSTLVIIAAFMVSTPLRALTAVITAPFRLIAKILSLFYRPVPNRRLIGIVTTLDSLRIVIYTNDHHPPHFHVITDSYNAKFDIENCALLGGARDFTGKTSKGD